MMIATNMLTAQQLHVFEEWAQDEGVQEFFYRNVTATDSDRSVYVAGATLNQNGDYDLLITKYNRDGDFLWKDTIAGPSGGHDFATDLVIDGEGNVVVCGSISQGGAQGQNMLVVKYDPDGFEYWRYSHDYDNNNDAAASVCVNSSNRIFVTGATQAPAGFADMLTINLNSDGTFAWEQAYDHNNLHDIGVKIIPSGGDVIVTGIGQIGATQWRVLALKYSQGFGTFGGVQSSSGSTVAFEEVRDMVIDDSGNIYLLGSTLSLTNGMDVMLIKLDDELNIEWTQTWDGSGQADHGYGVRVAPNGDVYVCGSTRTTTQGDDALLLKYNASGSLVWSQTYNGSHNGDDTAESMEWHPDGYLYLTGSSYVVSNLDYLTLKYDTTGALLWEITYNSPSNKNDRATNMAIDDDGDIIVSGQCEINDSTTTYYTVKYVEYMIDNATHDFVSNAKLGYTPQQGQLLRSDSTLAEEVKFYSVSTFPKVFLQDTLISFVASQIDSTINPLETLDLIPTEVFRFDMAFIGANPKSTPRGMNTLDRYSNYFLPHCGNGIVRVPEFGAIYYNSLWDNIDLIITRSGKPEYTFIVEGDGRLEDIKFTVEGASGWGIEDDDKTVEIDFGYFQYKFNDFVVLQEDSNGNLIELSWAPQFSHDSNSIWFSAIGVHDPNKPLILTNRKAFMIPLQGLCWSTFFGGTELELGSASCAFETGFCIAGTTLSFETFPENEGEFAFQQGMHGYVARFTEDGQLLWSAIHGGSDHTTFFDVARTSNSNFVYTGYTNSPNIPLNQGGGSFFQPVSSFPHTTAFVAEIASSGDQLLWATYFGGASNDRASTIVVDNNNHKYIFGYGQNPTSGLSFPLASGNSGSYYFDATTGQTGFIARFNEFNQLVWSTFVEGTWHIGDAIAWPDNKISIIGGTNNVNLPVVNGGSSNAQFSSSLSGDWDMFYGELSANGNFNHLTYVGGDGSDGISEFTMYYQLIALDNNLNVYFLGQQGSSGLELQAKGSLFFNDEINQNKPFVYGLNSQYELIYGSFLFDTPQNIGGVQSITFDDFNNMCISGWSTGDELPLVEFSGAYFQNSRPLNSKTGYFMIQNEFNGPIYASFLGGSRTDEISSSFFIDGNLFHQGITRSGSEVANDVLFPLFDPDTEAYFQGEIAGNVDQFGLYNVDLFLTKMCVEYTLSVESITSGSDAKSHLDIYPNPANDLVTISFRDEKEYISNVEFWSINGLLVKSVGLNPTKIAFLSVADLRSGVYFVRASSSHGNISTQKLLIR